MGAKSHFYTLGWTVLAELGVLGMVTVAILPVLRRKKLNSPESAIVIGAWMTVIFLTVTIIQGTNGDGVTPLYAIGTLASACPLLGGICNKYIEVTAGRKSKNSSNIITNAEQQLFRCEKKIKILTFEINYRGTREIEKPKLREELEA